MVLASYCIPIIEWSKSTKTIGGFKPIIKRPLGGSIQLIPQFIYRNFFHRFLTSPYTLSGTPANPSIKKPNKLVETKPGTTNALLIPGTLSCIAQCSLWRMDVPTFFINKPSFDKSNFETACFREAQSHGWFF